MSDPEELPLKKFENHSSALAIKQNVSVNQNFNFSNTDVSDILKEITAIMIEKNGTFSSTSTIQLKETSDFVHHQ